MFCVSCGAYNPDHAKFCFSCGGDIVSSPVPAVVVVKAVEDCPAPPKPELPTQTLPYRWGRFQGGLSLIGGAGIIVCAVLLLVMGEKLGDRMMGFALVSPLMLVGGWAFYWRKKFAVTMTYIWIALTFSGFVYVVLTILANDELTSEQRAAQVGSNFGPFVVEMLFWCLCCRYYRRRRSEFA